MSAFSFQILLSFLDKDVKSLLSWKLIGDLIFKSSVYVCFFKWGYLELCQASHYCYHTIIIYSVLTLADPGSSLIVH